MTRTFLDDDLLRWEVYASGGRHSTPERSRIIFHCVSDRGRRSRRVTHDSDHTSAQHMVEALPEDELREMLREAEELL